MLGRQMGLTNKVVSMRSCGGVYFFVGFCFVFVCMFMERTLGFGTMFEMTNTTLKKPVMV